MVLQVSIIDGPARIQQKQWPLLGRPPRPGDREIFKYRLVASHPDLTVHALENPANLDEWHEEYLTALNPNYNGTRLRSAWHHVGLLKEQLYQQFAMEVRAREAPKPRYKNVPGLSTGNGDWPRPEQPPDGQGPYAVFGVTVNASYEYLRGGGWPDSLSP